MSNTIKNFLIGIGLDTKDFQKGEKLVSGGLGRFRSKAGFAGAAMVGAFGAAGAAAITAGNRVDRLALSTEGLKTSIDFVNNYGNAIDRLGGEAAEAAAAILTAESALAQFKQAGNFGPLEQTIFAGVDTSALLQAQDGEEFIRMLADMVPDLSSEQQRILQDTLGFSDAVMRSLRQGSQAFDEGIERSARLAGNIQELADISREYNEQLSNTKLAIQGVSNALAVEMLPALTGILGSVNDFIAENKEGIVGAAVGFRNVPSMMTTPFGIPRAIYGGLNDRFGETAREKVSGAWGASGISDFSPVDSSMEWLGNRRQDAIERRIEYRESVNSQEAIQATPEYSIINNNNGERVTLPPQQINNNLDVKVQIDGREIDSRVVDTIERRERATIEDMQSTTVR